MKRMVDRGDSLKYESSTNTFEFGSNLVVDGDITTNTGFIKSPNGSIEISDDNYIYLNGINDASYITFELADLSGAQMGLTNKNTKTLFGNQSIYGSGNIDLYAHYLKFTVDGTLFYGVVYSSNNIVTDTLQKLTTLLKPPSSAQKFIPLTNYNNECGVLHWSGSIWQVGFSGGGLPITSVSDRIEPI